MTAYHGGKQRIGKK